MIATTIKISNLNQISLPPEVCEAMHWTDGTELSLLVTESGVLLQARPVEGKSSAKALRGFLQHTGDPVATEQLCQPVRYDSDSF